MNDSTTTEYFKLIKQHMELQLHLNGWRWSAQDSLLLDWTIKHMEANHAS